MIALAWVCALLALAFLAVELSNLSEFPELTALDAIDTTVDAYVAMRNEAANVDGALGALLSNGCVARCIVVDDASHDDTVARVQRYAVRDTRVECIEAPQHVTGKGAVLAWAVAQRAPRAPYVAFIDADVRTGPGCIAALVASARRRGAAAITAWPRVDARGVWALLASPAVTLFLLQALPMRAARGVDPRFSAGNGQLFLVEARAYALSGGHNASDDIVEDVALARTLKASGARVALATAARIAHAATYERLGDTFAGYGRSLYFGGGIAGCAFVALWQLFVYVAPWVLLPVAPLPATLALLAALCARVVAAARMRESWIGVALFPFSALLIAAIATYGAVAGPCGALDWRGRALQKRNAGR